MGQILIFDGAMGTMLQQRGLAPGAKSGGVKSDHA